jgi:hypothetical protein
MEIAMRLDRYRGLIAFLLAAFIVNRSGSF